MGKGLLERKCDVKRNVNSHQRSLGCAEPPLSSTRSTKILINVKTSSTEDVREMITTLGVVKNAKPNVKIQVVCFYD
jgi:hypothetical protein